MIAVHFLNGSRKGPLIQSLRKLVLGHAGLVWLSLSTVPGSLHALAQSQLQRPPIVRAPGAETSDDGQPTDRALAGSVSGTVVDGTGAVIVGARVTLTGGAQSPPQEVLSGDEGQFFFADVVPGAFQIRITAGGFATHISSGILRSWETYIAPPSVLAPAALSTQIEVTVPRTELAQEQLKAQEKQRVLGVFPNFYVSYVSDAVPLTSKQKFQLAWRTMVDPVTFALAGATAGVQQAQNDFSGYGQGAAGYAKRFGAAYADDATSTFIGSAILPSLLKQDPRYFYKGSGSAGSRILYAIANSVICKGDNGRWQPNYSAIGGGLASGAISNLYYPPKDRGAALVFENTLIGTGETALFNILQEFVLKRFTPHVPKYDPSHP